MAACGLCSLSLRGRVEERGDKLASGFAKGVIALWRSFMMVVSKAAQLQIGLLGAGDSHQ
jgi:hypothetical protein